MCLARVLRQQGDSKYPSFRPWWCVEGNQAKTLLAGLHSMVELAELILWHKILIVRTWQGYLRF